MGNALIFTILQCRDGTIITIIHTYNINLSLMNVHNIFPFPGGPIEKHLSLYRQMYDIYVTYVNV